jgi:hypothetical protein
MLDNGFMMVNNSQWLIIIDFNGSLMVNWQFYSGEEWWIVAKSGRMTANNSE